MAGGVLTVPRATRHILDLLMFLGVVRCGKYLMGCYRIGDRNRQAKLRKKLRRIVPEMSD